MNVAVQSKTHPRRAYIGGEHARGRSSIEKHCGPSSQLFYDSVLWAEDTVKLLGVEDAQIQIPEHRADKVWHVHDGAEKGCLMFEAKCGPRVASFAGSISKTRRRHRRSEIIS